MVCEISARHFSAQYFNQESEKKTLSTTRKTSSNLQGNEAFEFMKWDQNPFQKLDVKKQKKNQKVT